jgi:hypothetical protein
MAEEDRTGEEAGVVITAPGPDSGVSENDGERKATN